MKLDDVKHDTQSLVLATDSDVNSVESKLWVTLPDGYREFMTTIGEGILGQFVRIYAPWRIERELAGWRQRIDSYWFWEDGSDVLPKGRALECVIIGDTIDGDELVFHSNRPKRLFILPRNHTKIFEAGSDIVSAINWIFGSGELVEPFDDCTFEPFDSRLELSQSESEESTSVDPNGESLKDVLALGKKWAKRHGVRKLAEEERERIVKSSVKSESQTRVLYEGFMIEGELRHCVGYEIAWQIRDAASRLEIGVFQWHHSEGACGSSYQPNNANLAKIRESNSKS
jgi:hypothetical protein